MARFVQLLTPFAGRIVIDGTGLKDVYDIEVTWTAEVPQAPNMPAAADSGVSLFTALREQLGLRLTANAVLSTSS